MAYFWLKRDLGSEVLIRQGKTLRSHKKYSICYFFPWWRYRSYRDYELGMEMTGQPGLKVVPCLYTFWCSANEGVITPVGKTDAEAYRLRFLFFFSVVLPEEDRKQFPSPMLDLFQPISQFYKHLLILLSILPLRISFHVWIEIPVMEEQPIYCFHGIFIEKVYQNRSGLKKI